MNSTPPHSIHHHMNPTLYENRTTTTEPKKKVRFCGTETYLSNSSPVCAVIQRNAETFCCVQTATRVVVVKRNGQVICKELRLMVLSKAVELRAVGL